MKVLISLFLVISLLIAGCVSGKTTEKQTGKSEEISEIENEIVSLNEENLEDLGELEIEIPN